MNKYEIVTDSSCNLSEEKIEALGLHILSLSYIMDGKSQSSYQKGKKFDYKSFYNSLRNKAKASTSQVTTQMALDSIRPILENGLDVLYIGFSSALSGTFNAVAVALKELKEEFPDRKILFEDTLSASFGQAYFVLEAAKLKEEGKSIEEAHNFVSENKLKQNIWFTVDDLFHLQRGGRLSAGKALIGSALGVKPILYVDSNGKLVPKDKTRGRKKSLDFLADKVFELSSPKDGQTVYIMHGDCEEDANYVAKKIKEKMNNIEIFVDYLEPVIGVHGGPGIVGLVFMGNSR